MFSRKKKKRQHKYINGAKGAISILLCLLMTPFVSITLGLVEYHRYQSVIEITDEIMELVGLSTLTDYDPYIHDRFGLLAVSQQSDMDENASVYAKTAASSMGQQITMENLSVDGELSLAEKEVLMQQITDFSELNVTSAVLMDDFNIEQLINALNMVERFNTIINAVGTLADLAEKLTTVVEKGEALVEKLKAVQSALATARSTGETLVQKITALYEKLSNAGLYIPENASADTILSIVTTVAEDYKADIQGIVSTAKNLKSALESIKSKAQSCISAAEEFATAVEAAKNVVVSDGGDSKNGNISQSAKTTLENVLDEMIDASEEALNKLKQDSINILKTEVDTFIDSALDNLGIGDLMDRYGAIMDGSYFNLPLSPQAQSDLTSLLSLVPAAWNSGEADQLLATLRGMFVPNITSFNPDTLIDSLEDSLKRAAQNLANNAITEALKLLTKLINALKNLFDLDVFYEADLNAFVSVASAQDNPYQTFLDGIGLMFKAVKDFSDAMNGNAIEKLVGLLTAVKDMFKAVGKVLKGVITSAAKTITNVGKIIAEIATADFESLYKRLLVAGYMRHNLPCRTDSGDYGSSYEGGTISGWTNLSGSALTGFKFNDIARARDIYGQVGGNASGDKTAFEKLANTLNNLMNGAGEDRTFKGAELEYIRSGTNSELANQIFAFFDVYFLRLLLNAATVFGDAEVAGLAAAATIASWLVYLIYLLAEPFCDTILLVNGGEVDFIKSKCHLTAGGLTPFLDELADVIMDEALYNEIKNSTTEIKDTSSGNQAGNQNAQSFTSDLTKVDYKTNMLIVLVVNVEPETMIERLGDIIEMETTEYYKQQSKSFSMDKTYTTISVSADVTFDSFFDLGVASGSSSLAVGGTMTKDIGY